MTAIWGCRQSLALQEFTEHADATNDIFHVAAQVVASTLLRAAQALGSTTHPGAGFITAGAGQAQAARGTMSLCVLQAGDAAVLSRGAHSGPVCGPIADSAQWSCAQTG